MNDFDNTESPNYHAIDATLAAASDVKVPTPYQHEIMNSIMIEAGKANAQLAKIQEMHAGRLAKVLKAEIGPPVVDRDVDEEMWAARKRWEFQQKHQERTGPKCTFGGCSEPADYWIEGIDTSALKPRYDDNGFEITPGMQNGHPVAFMVNQVKRIPRCFEHSFKL